jgi:hypothetical protein
VHHVIEDCGITAENLAAVGISNEVIDAVVLLTRTDRSKADCTTRPFARTPSPGRETGGHRREYGPERRARLEPKDWERLDGKYKKALQLLRH